MKPNVDVLLATFNGARFLAEQLDSLRRQTHQDFRLVVSDDDSTDGTREILEAAAHSWGSERMTLLPKGKRLGVVGNFSRALSHARAPYVAFCDQDDVWLAQKLELLLARAQRIEARAGTETPVLVHSDLMVVDQALRVISPSFWASQKLDPWKGSTWRRLLIANVAVGCTVLMNRALVQLSPEVPEAAVMHDWWFALIASLFGVMEAEPEPTVLYRQHDANVAGARRTHPLLLAFNVLRGRAGGRFRRTLRETRAQAAALVERFGPRLPAEAREVISQYARIKELGPVQRRAFLVRSGIRANDLINTIRLMFRA